MLEMLPRSVVQCYESSVCTYTVLLYAPAACSQSHTGGSCRVSLTAAAPAAAAVLLL